jgi:S1-C subfamily serine protease
MRVYNQKNSPAVRAGLRPDDVILKFNGVEVIDENHLINLVSLSDIGVAVDIEVFRGSQMSQLAVTLMDREEYRTADDPRNTFNTR